MAFEVEMKFRGVDHRTVRDRLAARLPGNAALMVLRVG